KTLSVTHGATDECGGQLRENSEKRAIEKSFRHTTKNESDKSIRKSKKKKKSSLVRHSTHQQQWN
ncbi:hypothetical protein OFB58_24870, partial [Escherichia coli]|nr:hypothetical protein [Escherichia coli]